jgi:hypothetical protein
MAVLLGGCVNQLAVRQAQLGQLVGAPEGVLVQQMGVPNRTYETGGVKYLAYVDRRVDFIPSAPYPYGPPFWGWYGGGFPPQAVELVCETTFAVAHQVVQSFTLRGNACG